MRDFSTAVTDTIDIMKKLLLSAILLFGIVTFTLAGPVQTAIIAPGDPTLTVAVQSGQVLQILNFFTDSPTSQSFAFVTIGSHTARVMLASGTVENHIVVNLAGPATLTVNALASGNLTISYKVNSNM